MVQTGHKQNYSGLVCSMNQKSRCERKMQFFLSPGARQYTEAKSDAFMNSKVLRIVRVWLSDDFLQIIFTKFRIDYFDSYICTYFIHPNPAFHLVSEFSKVQSVSSIYPSLKALKLLRVWLNQRFLIKSPQPHDL